MNKIFLCFIFLFPLISTAKIFRNSYISFELPETWKCNLENTEYVCRSEATKESKEAIIILTAKEIGPTDSIDSYVSHLNTAQATSYKGTPGSLSKVVYPAKKVQINDQIWVDGLHMASEVPNYFTRYLATIKDKIAVLFTCSAHKDFYSKYSQDFFRAVSSLRVIATKNILAKPEFGVRPGNETLGAPIGSAMPGDILTEGGSAESEGSGLLGGNSKSIILAVALILAALGGYFLWKAKNKN